MSATRFGISINEVIAEPTFRCRRGEDGRWSGSRSYIIRKEDKDSAIIQSKFSRGVSITTLSDDLNVYWNFLQIQSCEFEDVPGGLCRVFVDAGGYSDEGEWPFDSEKTYTLRAVLTERPIIEHPKFISDLKASQPDDFHAYIAFYSGAAYVTDPTDLANTGLRDRATQNILISQPANATSEAWWEIIVEDGVRSYLAPQYEWTVSEANQGGLTAAQLSNFGKVEASPDGSPPEPSGVTGEWLFVDATDERGTNGSSNSRTWRFFEGTLANKIYDY